jgi:prepilin-type N-terminal cleavage/methylation domain-containing protein
VIRNGPTPLRRRGLTLVEVLVALALLAIVLLPVVVGLSQALAMTSDSTIAAAAASIARDKVEELKGMEFGDLGNQPAETRDLKPGDGFFQVSVAVTVVRAENAAHVGLKNAVVTVCRSGGTRPLAVLSTYVTPYGT